MLNAKTVLKKCVEQMGAGKARRVNSVFLHRRCHMFLIFK